MRRFILILCAACGLAPLARAWSNKEHILLTRMAAQRLLADKETPPEMKRWLKLAVGKVFTPSEEREFFMTARVGVFPRGVEGMAYWATVPDTLALTSEAKVAPFGVNERMLHYVDLEQFIREEPRRQYRHDLSDKPFDFEIPPSMKDGKWKRAGMLPFRIEQCYAELVRSLRDKRWADRPGQFPRDEHAARWGGFLAHYVEDNTQPQHATEDFRGRSYFADQRKAPNVHWDFEGRLCDDERADYPELRREFWDELNKALAEAKDPFDSEDLAAASVDVSLTSYDALPMIGLAAMKAYGQGGTPEKPVGPIGDFDAEVFFHFKGKYLGREMSLMEMKAHQMAWGVKRVQRLWKRAWEESQRPVEAP